MTLDASAFTTTFLPRWLDRVTDDENGGLLEWLDDGGQPDIKGPRTTLAQARSAFVLSHLYIATGVPRLKDGAIHAWRFLDTHLRDADGGYQAAVAADGAPMDDAASATRRSYDHSFVLLALVTLEKAVPGIVPPDRVPSLWAYVETLTDPATGALWEDNAMARDGAGPGTRRGQNPQMHMLEAVLQAYEMTGDPVWRDRATGYVTLARDHLVDPDTGAIREWVGADMGPLAGADGGRREPGHQFEWAWLLHRYAELGGEVQVTGMADAMIAFAEAHGVRRDGPMAGAPFDALDPAGAVREDTHLLWPITEAGKYYSARHLATGDADAAETANALCRLMFDRYFPAGPAPRWHNQLDGQGKPIQPIALSRLVYHVALFLTEGARAGLWPLAGTETPDTIMHREEFT